VCVWHVPPASDGEGDATLRRQGSGDTLMSAMTKTIAANAAVTCAGAFVAALARVIFALVHAIPSSPTSECAIWRAG